MDIKLNNHFLDVKETYLFSDIAKRVKAFQAANPEREIIRMGIGDVTLPLPASVTSAMEDAVRQMTAKESFHGYPPEYGYDFLRNAIADHYKTIGAPFITPDVTARKAISATFPTSLVTTLSSSPIPSIPFMSIPTS